MIDDITTAQPMLLLENKRDSTNQIVSSVIEPLPKIIESKIVGERINIKGLSYSPINEMGVIFLTGLLWNNLPRTFSHIETINPNGFPDAIGVVLDGNSGRRYKKVNIEFEYVSSNFKLHGHPIDQCDLLICWEDDWDDCPIEVIELQKYLKSWDEKYRDEKDFKDKFISDIRKFVRKFPEEYKEIIMKELKEKL